jgi:hypothetical protein
MADIAVNKSACVANVRRSEVVLDILFSLTPKKRGRQMSQSAGTLTFVYSVAK